MGHYEVGKYGISGPDFPNNFDSAARIATDRPWIRSQSTWTAHGLSHRR